MVFELRNIKCTYVLNRLSTMLLSKFEQRRYNLILRMEQTIILTIYPSSFNRVHATGIKSMSDVMAIKSLFKTCQIKIRDVVVDNTYWLKKPHIIKRFSEFAAFCDSGDNGNIKIDMTSYGMNGDGYFNAIYLKHREASGTVIIHRKCIAILGAKSSTSVRLLTTKVHNLITKYDSFLKKMDK